jgi:hypothetical protein
VIERAGVIAPARDLPLHLAIIKPARAINRAGCLAEGKHTVFRFETFRRSPLKSITTSTKTLFYPSVIWPKDSVSLG